MPLLRLSRLSALDVLLGKLWGLFVYLWPFGILPVGTSILFFYDSPWVPVATTIMTAVYLTAGTGFGLAFSSISRRPATAIVAAITSMIVYVSVPLALAKFGMFDRLKDLLFVFNPLMTIFGILDQFRRRSGGPWDREEFWLSLVGLLFLLCVAVFGLWASLVALYRKEEDAA